jgi:alpha-amylase/alpha-mannosidase (GH57 family)
MPQRAVCIHCHFYQPPREHPWLEVIPPESSAMPFRDWNERITSECYGANASARRVDASGRIIEIRCNYREVSFNIGPTLLGYLAHAHTETYAAILAADRESAVRHNGHGNAIAQVYNHVIMPLATERDRVTEVRWGLADFRQRFGREAEGMWLPETAVDLATLDALAAEGVRFTILAPRQAGRVRAAGEEDWRDVSDGTIDPRKAYVCRLPSGRSIALFFYDAALSHAVAFENILHSGDELADRIVGAFSDGDAAELVHLATDGESYGHHHRFGEMALAQALAHLGERGVEVTSYGAFLAAHPPESEVEIIERSSWSCAHGVERWRADCGCRAAQRAGWTQAWRVGLREGLDALAAELDDWYFARARELVDDPWALRDACGEVLADGAWRGLRAFLDRQAGRKLSASEARTLARLLESQRMRLLMFTSCGWFFDELTDLEGSIVLRNAARAIDLARGLGFAPGAGFLAALATAQSNYPERGSAADYFREHIARDAVGQRQLAAAAGIERAVRQQSALDGSRPPAAPLVDTSALRIELRPELELAAPAGSPPALLAARARVSDARTLEEGELRVAVMRFGLHDFLAAAQPVSVKHRGDVTASLERLFELGAYGAVVSEITRGLGGEVYDLGVLGAISRAALLPAVAAQFERRLVAELERHAPEARAIAWQAGEVNLSVPPILAAIVRGATGPSPNGGLVPQLLGVISAIASAPSEAALGESVARGLEALDRARSDTRPPDLRAVQDALWWYVAAATAARPGSIEALGPLADALGFAPGALTLASVQAVHATLRLGQLASIVPSEDGSAFARAPVGPSGRPFDGAHAAVPELDPGSAVLDSSSRGRQGS